MIGTNGFPMNFDYILRSESEGLAHGAGPLIRSSGRSPAALGASKPQLGAELYTCIHGGVASRARCGGRGGVAGRAQSKEVWYGAILPPARGSFLDRSGH